jgi:hypothetical protein
MDAVIDEYQHLCNLAQILDTVKSQDWAECWSPWDQEQRDWLTSRMRAIDARREMTPEDIGLPACEYTDHEWRYEWPEHDVGFCGFKECKHCGKQEGIERGDYPSFDDDVL